MKIERILTRLYDLGIKINVVDNKLKVQPTREKISNEILNEIKINKVELINYLKGGGTKSQYIEISNVEMKELYPLSSAQTRLYLLQQFDLTSTAYNMLNIISLEKEIDKSKIEDIFKQLINRHESFRTSINIVDQVPVQLISKHVEFELGELSIENTELENTRINFIKPFDLSQPSFFRAAIVDIKGEERLLIIDMHHIISDGISQTILEKEFQALLLGEELAPLPLQYKDYSQWQNSSEQQEFIKNQEQYWLNKFEGEIPVLNLPMDYVRPLMQSHEGAKVNFVLSKEETEGIRFFTKENDLTLYMSLLSIFSILLSKLSGQDDIIVGTPIAGRNHADLENIVGMFINTLSIRNEVKAEATIREFVSSLKQTVFGAYENQNYQFEDLVDKASVERDTSRNPIFDVMFNLLNQAEYSGDLSGIENLIHTKGVSKFDLTLTAVDYGEQLKLSFEYCTQLFKAETIDRFIVYFKKIVSQIARNSEYKISAIDILSKDEKHQLLYEFNNTKTDYPKDKTIYQLFEEQVAKTPDNIAVFTKDRSVNYRELHLMAEKLAKILRSNGVSSGSVVSLMLDRSIEMIIGLMGILRAGCCYLPIIPSMPKLRLDYVLEDSESPLILTQTKYEDKLTGVKSINLEELETLLCSPENLPEQNNPNNLAYIIYTSGTTGNPKGVMIENHSVLNRIKWMQKNYPISTGDIILQKTPYTFDVSVWELFWWCFEGASVYMLEPEGEKDPQLISKTIEEKKINVMHFVPSMLEAYLKVMEPESRNINLGSMKYVFSSGEALRPSQVHSFYQLFTDKVNTKLVNLYGPTEATVDVSCFDCLRDVDYKTIPIGKPIDNTELYILDKNSLQLQGVGIIGELMISGVGLSRGYLKKDELTKEKFIDHPYKEG
ncbi:MAG: amino acid adenylation domain-containing protein, partial [Bacteroidales bacterium]|nr:amino acid adenylation domain-containing protein [Bacteroidales bacterium]